MRRAVFLLLPLLAGCATGPSLQTRMISFMDAPEGQLVQTLGVPDKQITVNGITYLAYVRQRAQVAPTTVVGFGSWGSPWGAPWGPYGGFGGTTLPAPIQVWSCETTFTVKDGHVANVTFRGNACN
jgi:hypothetical protein